MRRASFELPLRPGEMTEQQWQVANQFLRLIHVMQERLSAGVCALQRVGIELDEKPFDRAFWDLAALTNPIDKKLVEHLDAQIASHFGKLDGGK